MKAWFLAAGVILVASVSLAQHGLAYTVKGAGECSGWVGGEDDRFWVLGFISGYNAAKNADFGRGDAAEKIYRFVSHFCKERPNADLADAAMAYITTQ